ncbi:integral peroxisomal membrane peroxin-domain-containing protein [Pilobolus umbonatus]|nr:integral peroxisomal membrane peroxin-domain-containing protein [Pilobolus umbonatus]
MNFSSPYAVPNIDQIPTPILRLLVVMGPTLRQTTKVIDIITWKTDQPRLSVLAVLIWVMACLWTWQLLAFGIPSLVLYKLAKDWLSVNTSRARREGLEKLRQTQRQLREEKLRKAGELDEDDDDERMVQLRLQQQKEEEDELISRKIRPEGEVSLDDALEYLGTLNAFIDHIRTRIQSVLVYVDGTRPDKVISLLSMLMYVWPLWIIVNWLLGPHLMFAVLGSIALISPSPWFSVISMAIRRNIVLTHLLTAFWAYGVALLTMTFTRPISIKEWLKSFIKRARTEKSKAMDVIKPTVEDEERKGTRSEMIFQFEVYENQRWWLGVKWTTNMMPNERGPWTDNQLKPIPSKEHFELPETTSQVSYHNTNGDNSIKRTTHKVWTWADGDWWVDMTGEIQGMVDPNGWEYGNNAWKQLTGMPGMQTFTRRRRWCRRARLIAQQAHVPEVIEYARSQGDKQFLKVESNYPYLQQRLPAQQRTDKEKKKLVKKVERLAKYLDAAIPHSPIPVGLDSLLGFIPLVGGAMASVCSLYLIYLCSTMGIPLWLLLRMLFHIAVDFLLNLIPVLGGFAHMFYKANIYNYEAFAEWVENPTMNVMSDTRSGSSQDTPKEITWTQLLNDVTGVVYKYKEKLSKPVEKKIQ